MKLVIYREGDNVAAGVVVDDHVVPLHAIDGAPTDVTQLLAAGPSVLADVARKRSSVSARTPLSEVALQAPVPRPSKYRGLGLNFGVDLDEIPGVERSEEFDRVVGAEEAFVAVEADEKLGGDVAEQAQHAGAVDEAAAVVRVVRRQPQAMSDLHFFRSSIR